MVSFLELGPFFLLAAAGIALYLAHRLSKIIQQLKKSGQVHAKDCQESSAAQALCELGKANPDFSSLISMMRDDVRRAGGERIQACRTFLSESEGLSSQDVTEISTFRRLYYGYLEAIEQSYRRGNR